MVKEVLGQATAEEMGNVVKKAADRKAQKARESMHRDSFGRAVRSVSEAVKSQAPEGEQIHVDSSGRAYYRDSLGRARRVR